MLISCWHRADFGLHNHFASMGSKYNPSLEIAMWSDIVDLKQQLCCKGLSDWTKMYWVFFIWCQGAFKSLNHWFEAMLLAKAYLANDFVSCIFNMQPSTGKTNSSGSVFVNWSQTPTKWCRTKKYSTISFILSYQHVSFHHYLAQWWSKN